MTASKTDRYTYHFEFFGESGKVYSRTRRLDHKITDQEESDFGNVYVAQISAKQNDPINSWSCSYLGKDKFNDKYVTNIKLKYPLEIKEVIEQLSKYEWQDDEWAIAFDYQNIDGYLIHFYGSIPELWKDWMDEAELCPSNDTMCWNIDILAKNKPSHWYISNDSVSVMKFTFEDLMGMLCHCLTLETIEIKN